MVPPRGPRALSRTPLPKILKNEILGPKQADQTDTTYRVGVEGLATVLPGTCAGQTRSPPDAQHRRSDRDLLVTASARET